MCANTSTCAGAFFGEQAILGTGKRNATITANSHLVLLRLERETCRELLGSIKDIIAREAERRAHQTNLVEEV